MSSKTPSFFRDAFNFCLLIAINILFFLLFTTTYASHGLFTFTNSTLSKRLRVPIRVVPSSSSEVATSSLPQIIGQFTTKHCKEIPPPPTQEKTPKVILPKPKKPAPEEKNTLVQIPYLPPPPETKLPLSHVHLDELPEAPLVPSKKLGKPLPINKMESKRTPPKRIMSPRVSTSPLPLEKSYIAKLHHLPMHFGSNKDFDRNFGEYIVIDTEATGLGNEHELTEVAAVKVQNMQPTGEKFHVFLNPGREVSASAHKLTLHTWRDLKRFPTFREVSHKFLAFIGDSPLVFHNAHFDLKLLNKGLKDVTTYKLEERHTVIDTYLFSKKVNPRSKNGLTYLGNRYNLKRPGSKDVHGALIDADLLCEVFRGLYRENGSRLPTDLTWEKLPRITTNSFPAITHTPGEDFFRELGLQSELPNIFRYSYNLYNPKLHRNFPAILIPFSSIDQEDIGTYVRYIINRPIKKSLSPHEMDLVTRSFYGDSRSFLFCHLHGSKNPKTLVLGSISACLIFREHHILRDSTFDYITHSFGSNIGVQAYLEPHFLAALEVSNNVETIVVLSERDPSDNEDLKKAYYELISRLCLPQFLPFSKYKGTQSDFAKWLVRVNGENWMVRSQESATHSTTLFLTSIKYPTQKMQVEIDNIKLHVLSLGSIPHSCGDVLFSPPRKKLVLVPLWCKNDGNTTIKGQARNLNYLYSRLKARLFVSQPKDLAFYDKIYLAQKLYEDSLSITSDTPVAKYFQNRGVQSKLPESFKYMQNMFHPGQEANFPTTIVPLKDAEGRIVAIHRLFCDEDGNQLLKKSGYPSKLSLGKASGASAEIFTRTSQNCLPDTLLISEGIENALVARESLIRFLSNGGNKKLQELFSVLRAVNGFTLHAVVGVNGFIDAPLPSNIKTIFILADNDADNKDVKSTLIKTVAHYFSSEKKVNIVLPYTKKQTKTDLNDIYLSYPSHTRDDIILDIIKNGIEITSIEQLGAEDEPLEKSLKKLMRSIPTRSITTHAQSIGTLEQQLMDLISDKLFIQASHSTVRRK